MKAYNIEIFDRDFVYRSHSNISSLSYSDDYLSPETNSIIVQNSKDTIAKIGDYIRITNDDTDIFGVVTKLQSEDEYSLTISFKSFLSFFDLDILFDTSTQHDKSVSLEDVIAQTIFKYFSYNSDEVMNLPGVVVTLTSTTVDWSLNIQPDSDAGYYSGGLSSTYNDETVTLYSSYVPQKLSYSIVNFFKKIIIGAFEKYSIRIKAVPNFRTKKIMLYIGVNNASERTLEADLPNVIKKYVTISNTENSVNKLVVYNSETYADPIIFYRHPDNTFGIRNEDRIVPVIQEMCTTSPTYEDDIMVITFPEAAVSQAYDIFSSAEYSNLIELTMSIEDSLYNPLSFDIGQKVNIISDGKIYPSILSGYTINNSTITLIFGLVRVDLTKQIRRSSYGY